MHEHKSIRFGASRFRSGNRGRFNIRRRRRFFGILLISRQYCPRRRTNDVLDARNTDRHRRKYRLPTFVLAVVAKLDEQTSALRLVENLIDEIRRRVNPGTANAARNEFLIDWNVRRAGGFHGWNYSVFHFLF